MNVALHVDGALLRIETASEVLRQDGIVVGDDVLGVGCCREGVPVSDEEVALLLILKLKKIDDSPEVIPHMEVSGRTYAAYDGMHRSIY